MHRLNVLVAAMCLWFAMGHAPLRAQFSGGGGVPVDKQAPPSIAELERGCSGGRAIDCDLLGMRHLRGEGVAKDPKKAAAYFQRACDRGDARGCFNLGDSYQFGEGVPKDAAKAAAFYLRACDGREPAGCAELAMSHIAGDGVKQSEAQAALYADRACALKNQLGCAILGAVYADGIEGYPQDLAKAKELLFDACHHKVDYTKKPDDAARLACPTLAKLTGEPACATVGVFGSPTGEVRRHCFDAQAGWVTTVTQNAAPPVAKVPVPAAPPPANAALSAGNIRQNGICSNKGPEEPKGAGFSIALCDRKLRLTPGLPYKITTSEITKNNGDKIKFDLFDSRMTLAAQCVASIDASSIPFAEFENFLTRLNNGLSSEGYLEYKSYLTQIKNTRHFQLTTSYKYGSIFLFGKDGIFSSNQASYKYSITCFTSNFWKDSLPGWVIHFVAADTL